MLSLPFSLYRDSIAYIFALEKKEEPFISNAILKKWHTNIIHSFLKKGKKITHNSTAITWLFRLLLFIFQSLLEVQPSEFTWFPWSLREPFEPFAPRSPAGTRPLGFSHFLYMLPQSSGLFSHGMRVWLDGYSSRCFAFSAWKMPLPTEAAQPPFMT